MTVKENTVVCEERMYVVTRNIISKVNAESQRHETLHRESKNGATLTVARILSVLYRFAKFFRCFKEH